MAKKESGGKKPKLANCSPNDVFSALKKLGGFAVNNAARHDVVVHIKTGKKSTIPRVNPINRHLLKDFVEDYLVKSSVIPRKKFINISGAESKFVRWFLVLAPPTPV